MEIHKQEGPSQHSKTLGCRSQYGSCRLAQSSSGRVCLSLSGYSPGVHQQCGERGESSDLDWSGYYAGGEATGIGPLCLANRGWSPLTAVPGEVLAERGLHGVRLVVSDDYPGLQKAVRSVFKEAAWQYCQHRLQRNARELAPSEPMKRTVTSDLRYIFAAPGRQEAEARLECILNRYRPSAPILAAWLERHVPEGFAVYDFPEPLRPLIRSVHVLERFHQELRRRTRSSSGICGYCFLHSQ